MGWRSAPHGLGTPEGQHQHITPGRRARIQRLDRGDAVPDTLVINQGDVQRLGQGEGAELGSVGRMDGGAALADVVAIDQGHQHVVHAIAMHAFRRRLAGLAGQGFDAELVGLDLPALHLGGQLREQHVGELAERAEG